MSISPTVIIPSSVIGYSKLVQTLQSAIVADLTKDKTLNDRRTQSLKHIAGGIAGNFVMDSVGLSAQYSEAPQIRMPARQIVNQLSDFGFNAPLIAIQRAKKIAEDTLPLALLNAGRAERTYEDVLEKYSVRPTNAAARRPALLEAAQ